MAEKKTRKLKIPTEIVDTMPGRGLHKTKIDRGIFERAVGKKKPNVLSHRNNTKFRELPY